MGRFKFLWLPQISIDFHGKNIVRQLSKATSGYNDENIQILLEKTNHVTNNKLK